MMATRVPRLVPFAYGFRPFFLLAGMYAVIAVGLWLWLFRGGARAFAGGMPQFWHGHEMLFGFATAAIGGFLLTAVPSWTGRRGLAGNSLVVLVVLWLAGRIAMSLQHALPWTVIVIAELAFLPALIVAVAPPLMRTVNRNRPLLLVLLALWCCDAVYLYGIARQDAVLVSGALRGALDFVLVLLTVIGGRIVPAFTANALRARGSKVRIHSRRTLELAVIIGMLAYAAFDIAAPSGTPTAIIAAIAGLLQFWRLSGWQGLRTLSQPIVWVLHLAYLWLPVGLILKALSVATGTGWAAHSLHALGAGAAGMMIVSVMTRAALGHTGRRLEVPVAIAVAYMLLAVAVLVRVFGPSLWPASYAGTIVAAGALWMLAFGIYAVVYIPILLMPRIDGKTG